MDNNFYAAAQFENCTKVVGSECWSWCDVFGCVEMASSLSEQQKVRMEENRQRALALRAARQQQQLTVANGSWKNQPVNGCQSVSNTTSVRSLAASQPLANTSSTGSGRELSSRPQTTAEYRSMRPSVPSSGCKRRPTTLADTLNRAPSATDSCSKVALGLSASAPVTVKCCLVSKQRFAADARYSAPLVELFKSIPSKQYGNFMN